MMDANEYYLNQYLKQEEAEERRQQAIEDGADVLMEGEYSPFELRNYVEALSELLATNDEVRNLRYTKTIYMTTEQQEFLKTAVKDYWRKLALDRAERDLDWD